MLVGTALGAGVLVMGTGAANAASADDLARLRVCESGNNYSINTGNGYYGAYQFSPATWRSLGYGGLPHNASPATQDEAARALQARSGWGQWPACSRKLGLRNGATSTAAAAAPAPAPAPPKPVPAPDVPRASRGVDVALEEPEIAPKESAAAAAQEAIAPAPHKSVTRKIAPSPSRALSQTTTSHGAAASDTAPGTAPALAPRFAVVVETHRVFSPEVKAWQARMDERGWTIAVDGYFGPESASVVRRFAAEKGMAQGPVVTLDKTVFDGAWTAPVTATVTPVGSL